MAFTAFEIVTNLLVLILSAAFTFIFVSRSDAGWIRRGDRYPLTLDETLHLRDLAAKCDIDANMQATYDATTDSSLLAPIFDFHEPYDQADEIQDHRRLNAPVQAVQALEDGLTKLHGLSRRPTWQVKYNQIELLGDLEEYESAKLLAKELLAKDLERPIVTWSEAGSRRSVSSSLECLDPLAEFDQARPSAKQRFTACIVAEQWDRGKVELYGLRNEDPDYFSPDQYVHQAQLGMLWEGLALLVALSNNSGDASDRLMEDALRAFNTGCSRTEPLRALPGSALSNERGSTLFDRFGVCANLFMSAARICVYFHQKGERYTKSPGDLSACDPPLTGTDWAHQALHFLETGRSRVLFDSIKAIKYHGAFDSRNSTMPPTPALIADSGSEPLEGARTPSSLNHQNMPLLCTNVSLKPSAESPQMEQLSWSPTKSRCSATGCRILEAEDALYDEPGEGICFPMSISDKFSTDNKQDPIPDVAPTIVAPVATARTFSTMSASVPNDSAIVIYGLASQKPHRLLVIVVTTQKVELTAWTPWEEKKVDKVHQQVGTLQALMNAKDDELRSTDARIVHVAAHGTFDKDQPMSSTIDLFGGISTEDLTKTLTIRADLVVFSACLSGFSEVYESGLSFSFAHALLSKGTTAFIGALWRVEDAPTLLLMMEFYTAVREGHSPVKALHKAQSSMRTMTQDRLDGLVEKLDRMVEQKSQTKEDRERLEDFVHDPESCIQAVRESSPEHLRKHHCWGAFLLVGYGHNAVVRP
ncbi:hypothetical protein FKW77_006205 [Venturia effusa]|uniref:CHAT domain-containing protein n=1 Tax=Venturia effusa TaxID=50376 RepID=A0A517LLM2_9PEZI|nr:hypothetical protein FKW77_006205 [Venturia effusa]